MLAHKQMPTTRCINPKLSRLYTLNLVKADAPSVTAKLWPCPAGHPQRQAHVLSILALHSPKPGPIIQPQAAWIALAFAYSARPAADLPPMGTKPLMPNAFRAALVASAQALIVFP